MRVDQWVPAMHRGDAIGDSTLLMRETFRAWGHTADIYAPDVDEDLEGEVSPFSGWRPGGPDDVVILHYALPSPMTEALKRHRGRRVLLHHNITPPEFYARYDPEMVRICALGRAELSGLRDHVDLALADSEFSRRELESAGFGRTGVLPIYLDFDRYRQRPSPVLLRCLRDGRHNVLFVGRLAPNKRPEDLLRVTAYWKRFISPDVRLLLVGQLPRRRTGQGRPLTRHYFDGLQSFLYELGFTPEEAVITGHVPHTDLLAYYAAASVFLSMSEHEGFGVPLVEAMIMDVPILAYESTAVGFTLGESGVRFTEKRVAEVAEMAHLLATDQALREAILTGQRRRLAEFAPTTVEATLRGHIEAL
jgi:glycosyltransferase involved in cell wall biosynthesis